MRIGVAKEIKQQEYRVALTPAGALELVQRGHEVVVQHGAGVGSGFANEAYSAVGARLADVEEVWSSAELLLKVKEPIESEYGRLREGLTLFTYLHIAANEPLTRALLDSGVTGVAYETVETADRRLEVADRDGLVDAVRDVVGADRNHRSVRMLHAVEGVRDLDAQIAGLGPHDGDVGEPHPTASER